MTLRFECLQCGRCCNRIRVESNGLMQGLSLLPGEEALFAEFPDAVMPYAAIRNPRHRKTNMNVVSYQMVLEPCPLYDPDASICTRYDTRPATCRAYPFSFGGMQIEANCGWHNSVQSKLHFGETPVIHGKEQAGGGKQIDSFFTTLHKRMQRTGRTQLLLYDIDLQEWVLLVAKDDP